MVEVKSNKTFKVRRTREPSFTYEFIEGEVRDVNEEHLTYLLTTKYIETI